MKRLLYIMSLAGMVSIASCTDLEPVVYSDVLKDEYFKTPEQFSTLLANAYAQLAGEHGYVYREGYWSLQEYTSDEVIVPTRGTEWYDNGVPVKMHQHKWETDTRDINNGWSFAYGGVGKCNEVLGNIKQILGDDESAYDEIGRMGVAETKVLRAFYHLLALDLYGNVAISVSTTEKVTQNTRKEVFNFIEREILDNISALQKTPSYGRVTQGVAHAMLAKLYLNAKVYTDEERWQEALDHCNEVINGSYGYALTADYFTPFAINNVNCPEIIFPVVFDAVYAKGNMFHLMTLHYTQQDVYKFTTPTWNGPCATYECYARYDEKDVRRNQWFTGPVMKDGKVVHFVKGQVNADAIIVPKVTTISDATENNTFEGARFIKFELEEGIEHHANNDFPIYRLADFYLMKAEAIMRLNGEVATQEAVDAVNILRARADMPNYTVSTLTMKELLDERSRELAWEGHRRQDQIRFDTYKDSWAFKDVSERTRYLFPIPKWVMDAAPGVYTQNPGY